MNWLQAQPATEERNKLISYLSKPITGVALKELRDLWKGIRKSKINNELIYNTLGELRDKFPHPDIETPTLEELKQEDLQIIGWIALC